MTWCKWFSGLSSPPLPLLLVDREPLTLPSSSLSTTLQWLFLLLPPPPPVRCSMSSRAAPSWSLSMAPPLMGPFFSFRGLPVFIHARSSAASSSDASFRLRPLLPPLLEAKLRFFDAPLPPAAYRWWCIIGACSEPSGAPSLGGLLFWQPTHWHMALQSTPAW